MQKKQVPDIHLFICTNGPDKVGKCGSKKAEELRRELKEKVSQEPWSAKCRVNASGCLGQCESGIAAVIYPEKKWYFGLSHHESEKLLNDLKIRAEDK
jgi:(2Fe-2S) ferredoxin